MSMNFSLKDYFYRINYDGGMSCNEQTLIDIHRQQCFHIPFDMLDPHLGIEPCLDPDFIFEKLVYKHRGGGCSQINELLALVLSELGFKVERLMARVLYGNSPGDFAVLAHKILLVKFDDKTWLCDTGFGGNGIIEPVSFVLDTVYEQFNEKFKIVVDKQFGYQLQTLIKGKWEGLYAFNLSTYYPQDFIAMHYHNSKNKKMIFARHCIITLPTSTGRKILKDLSYKERKNGESIEIEIKDVNQYHQILKDYFDIELLDNPTFFPSTSKVA